MTSALKAMAPPLPSRRLHRAMVPLLAAPLLLTLVSGIGLSRFHNPTLYALHTGDFGRLNLTGSYTVVLGVATLLLLLSGLRLWWQRP